MKQKGRNISATKNDFLEVLELSYKRHYNLLYNYGLKFVNDTGLIETLFKTSSSASVNEATCTALTT